ncbi:unnamed protein product [Lactuca saligna]|uniref:Serine/threonine-protein phosphatase 2A 55 kDa regulatory subunit B n=1 Tax=Lactuca saligna TaxID=75948 RepID=A0AA35ZNF0_LACSI|nr:unnamed protein product [Lactuca saligna]
MLLEKRFKKHGVLPRVLEGTDCSSSCHPEFRYKTEFQSYEPEFDYSKILEIEEKINKIKWFQTANSSIFLLSSNDKTIKFWKVISHDSSLLVRCRRTYAYAHDYHINSISNNSDGETFISTDDLRINLWNFEIKKVITTAEFHHSHCSNKREKMKYRLTSNNNLASFDYQMPTQEVIICG